MLTNDGLDNRTLHFISGVGFPITTHLHNQRENYTSFGLNGLEQNECKIPECGISILQIESREMESRRRRRENGAERKALAMISSPG